jgi:hypothetical protein
MLLREDGEAVIAIPQPSHSWLSGQLARAWGNDRFAQPSPFEEVCLAAEQHDIGWLTWEAEPTLDPASGRPRTFMQVGPETHTALWRDGVRRAGIYGRFAALLVSLHADTIYSRFFRFDKAPPEEARLVRAFLDEQHAFQQATIASLLADPLTAADAAPEVIERNRLTIAALDWVSLHLCWGVKEEVRVPEVPVAGRERIEMRLRPGAARDEVIVEPWPFGPQRLAVRAEGKRLSERYTDDEALRAALKVAEPVPVRATLRRA